MKKMSILLSKQQLIQLFAVILLILAMSNTASSQFANPRYVCYGDPIYLFCGGIPGCGVNGASYIWTTNAGTWTSTDMDPVIPPGPDCLEGKYFLSVSYPPGLMTSGTANVTIRQIFLTATITPMSCSPGNDAAILALVSGGSGPFTYQWNTGPQTSGITGLGAGTYTVTVTDDLNCTAIGSWLITSNLTIAGTLYPESCSPGNDAWIDLSVSGGCTPFDYDWSSGAHTQDILNLTCGNTYTVTVTDGSNSIQTASWVYEDVLLDAVVLPAYISSGCNNGSIDLSVSCGIQPYSYLWSTQETTEDISGLCGGTYCVTVTDQHSVSRSCCYMVGGAIPNHLCYGDPIYLYCGSAPGCGVNGASYMWACNNSTWTSTDMNPVIMPHPL